MSETNRLGINITATDTASATIRQLAAQAKALEAEIARANAAGIDQSGAYAAALRKPLAEITNQIAAIREQEAAIKRATAAIKEQAKEYELVKRTLQQNIDLANGSQTDRMIKSAVESAKTLAMSLSAAAEADSRLRGSIEATTAALKQQEITQSELAKARAEAVYINRDKDLASSKTRSEAVYENRDKDLAGAKQRSEAEYENTNLNLIKQKERAEAEYINASMAAAGAKQRSEAEYANADLNLIKQKQRMEAEYINAGMAAAEAKSRAEAEYENANLALIEQKQRTEAEYANRDIDLIRAKERAEAEYINQITTLQLQKARLEAELINQNMDLIKAKGRAEAEYIDTDIDLIKTRQRAEAEYINASLEATNAKQRAEAAYANQEIDLIKAKQRAEAEYINAGMAAEAAKARAEAEYTNQQIELIKAKERAEAEYINSTMDAQYRKDRALAEFEEASRQQAYINMRQQADIDNAMFNAKSKNNERSNSTNYMPELRHSVALFDEMSRGQRGAMFGTIGAMFRDAGVSATTLATSIAGLMTVMAGQAILRGAENMGKWAEETRAAASAAGMGIEQYSALQGALSLVGVKAESANASLRHVAESLNQALADPASRAAEAFHNLGISQEELNTTGGNIGKLLPFLADAFARTADGAGKTAAMEQIAGRGFENLIPALQGGSRELKALEEKAQDAGLTLTDLSANTLVKTGEKVKELSLEIGGSAKKAFEEWAPVIDSVVTSLGHLIISATTALGAVGKLTVGLGKSLGNQISDETESGFQPSMYGDIIPVMPSAKRVGTGPGRAPSGPPIQPPAQVPLLTTPVSALEQMRQDMTTAAFSASQSGGNRSDLIQKETQAEIDAMQNTLATAKLTDNERVQISNELNQKRTQLANQTASAETVAAKQSYQDFVSNERLKLAEAANNGTKIIAVYNEWLSAAETRFKQSAATITDIEREKVQTINHLRLQEIKDSSEQEQRNNRTTVVMGQAQAIAGGTMGYAGERGSTRPPGEGTAALADQAQAIEAAMQKQVAQLTQAMNIAEKGSSDQRAAAQEIQSVVTNAKTEEIALYNKAAEASIEAANKTAASFNKFFDILGNSFQTFTDTVLRALIAPQTELIKQGLTTIKKPMEGNEIRQAGSKALLGVVTDFAQSLQNTLTQTLAKSLSGGATSSLTTLLSSKLMSLLNIGTTAATQAPQAAAFGLSATALTTAGTALTSAGAVLDTGAITLSAAATTLMTAASAMAVSSGGGGISGIMQFLPELAEFSSGGIVPSAAGGMVVGGLGATLAILHQKEMVLPAHLSTGIQQMVNRGGDTSNRSEANLNYSPTINTASRSRNGTGMTRGEFAQMMALHSGAMLGEARNMMRSGWRPA